MNHSITLPRKYTVLCALVGGLACLAPTLASAQSTVVIGGQGQSSVEVNLDVLNNLGPAPGVLGIRPDGGNAGGLVPNAPVLQPLPGLAAGATAPTTSALEPRVSLLPPASPTLATPPAPVARRVQPLPTPPAAVAPVQPPAPARTVATPAPQPVQPAPRVAAPVPTPAPKAVARTAPAPLPPSVVPPAPAAVAAKTARTADEAPPPAAAPRTPITAEQAPATAQSGTAQSGTAQQEPAPIRSEPATAQGKTTQVAALPRVALPAGGGQAMTVRFNGSSSALNADAERQLAGLADQMARSDGRLQLKAFAGGSGGNAASAARRLSLSRALSVRSYLIEKGIRSTRIDVRALGVPDDDGPPERVDIILLAR